LCDQYHFIIFNNIKYSFRIIAFDNWGAFGMRSVRIAAVLLIAALLGHVSILRPAAADEARYWSVASVAGSAEIKPSAGAWQPLRKDGGWISRGFACSNSFAFAPKSPCGSTWTIFGSFSNRHPACEIVAARRNSFSRTTPPKPVGPMSSSDSEAIR